MTDTWLIIGLGNPGAQYQGNRHNVGQMVLDELAGRMGAGFKTHKARAQVVEGRLGIGGPRVVLAKPMTYMNVSGGPVSDLANFYGISPDRVVAVHDEIDIPFNTVKLKTGGGEGGHNGLRDISKALATKDYLRVRVGVGRPPGRMDTADYVLRDFGTAELKELPFLLDEAADAVELLLREGLTAAQQKFHPAKQDK
ncbi:peptidyl-tRNA hydrolase, PTH1 family [Pseudarthrobacter enclensis]|uniref:Peptidyl-tRNA hydrolase n=1 Tax=Pseudarthrobacter enclensis TaxID=993070 RepID=A0A0V8IJS8_9MICC|nr:aminoacyl-tRNA hydrolase [Pseudarthrobacter enclensis]KSU75047.1 peptidyl-tRNA hydrolase [Pseudarthrobacter enclensis]SCC16727.1 peptidyl-tRNA hydrolase, PTH1 family [Pseudarthrobacter enclensis]